MQEIKFKKGIHFEERLVQALIVDHPFAEQMLEVLDVDYFSTTYLSGIVKMLFDFYYKYTSFPSYKTLVVMIRDTVEEDVLKEKMIQYLLKIKKEPLNGDMDYIKEQALDFCRKRALANAMDSCLDLIEERKYESIVNEMQKALIKGSEKNVGHVFLDEKDFTKRMQEIKRSPVATPWQEINEITKGGPSAGELCVIMASTGVGKSHALVDIGAAAASDGKNVLHYTFELSELDTGKRYDARYSGVPPEQLIALQDRVRESEKDIKGKIIIKSYPCKTATILTLKGHIRKLAMMDFKPDLLVIDYADLMRSKNKYDQKRLEEESVYEELRSLAQELCIPIWTVAQANRSSLDTEVITLKHVAECYQKTTIADLFITMNRKKEDNLNTVGNFYIAKSRLGEDGIKFPILVNTALSRIKVLPKDSLEDDDSRESRLRKKFKEFKTGT